MRKRLLTTMALVASSVLAATSFTTHYNLGKPGDGDIGWGSTLRDNMDTIDTQLYANSEGIQDHIDDTAGAHAASAISATVGTLCSTEDTVQEFLDCLDSNFAAIVGGTVVTTNTVQTITAAKTFTANTTFTSGVTISGGTITMPFVAGVLKSDGSGVVSSSAVVDADVDAAAAISYSKLSLASSIVSADLVDGTIVDGDVSASAALARSKLASGTASHVVINDGSGVMSSEAQLSPLRGGTGVDASAAANGKLLVGNGTGFTIASLTGSANQVTVTEGSGTLALSLPQSIATTSDVTFDDITGTTSVNTPLLKATSSAGVAIQSNSGTAVAEFGQGGGSGVTFEGGVVHKGTVALRETGGGTDNVTLSGPASTTGYTITMPGSAPTANTALAYDGANYVWSSAGGWTTYANENVAGSGSVTTSTTVGQQVRRVTGDGAAVTISTTPFGAVGGWSDGLVVRLIGQSSTNTVTIAHNDAAKGAILNGDVTLGQYDVIELQYDSTADRWIEIARSVK
jgi:cytoskeletal protein CcmA (bactofilin family)